MIPDLQTSLLCDDVRQERNGKFIVIGIFDGLFVAQLPGLFPRLCLVNRWCCGQGTFQQRSRIMAPDGTTIVCDGQPIPITLSDEQQIATTVEVFQNVPFRTAGPHWVEVQLDQQMRLRYPLHVRPAPAPQPPAAPAAPQ